MALIKNQNNNNGITNSAFGSLLEDDTAAAIDVETGFRPSYVCVVNQTSRDMMEWFEGMTAGHAIKTLADGTRSAITSNGITVNERGFKIGLDTDVNVKNEQMRWRAVQ